MEAEGRKTLGEILLLRQILERGGKTVGAQRPSDAADLFESLSQSLCQSGIAFPSKNHIGETPPAACQPEMSKTVIEGSASDRHLQSITDGEVHDALPTRRMLLGKVGETIWTMHRSPVADTALECAPISIRKSTGIPALESMEEGNRLKRGRFVQFGNELVPNILEGISAGPVRLRCANCSAFMVERACGRFVRSRSPNQQLVAVIFHHFWLSCISLFARQ